MQLYVRVPFVAGVWAYGFTGAAAITVGLRWLGAGHVTAQRPVTDALLAVATLGILGLGARTVLGLARGTFLLRAPAPGRVAA